MVCLCSWYSCATPNGCASWDYPLNTMLRVTERHNGLSVIVKVVERGPAHRLVKEGVRVDFSREAFSVIDAPILGRAEVKVEVIFGHGVLASANYSQEKPNNQCCPSHKKFDPFLCLFGFVLGMLVYHMSKER